MSAHTNWAGNLTYSADRLTVPETVEDVRDAVRGASKVRALGSRHCFNDIADTTGTHLSLQRLNRVISLDRTKSQVTVDGGIRYGDLAPELHAQGYALHNLASLPHISIAGAVATGTHGSGAALGNLATAVAALELVNADGDLVTLSRETDGDTLSGAVVGLGAVGIATKLTLDVQPTFNVRQDLYDELPLTALDTHFGEIMASGRSVSLFTDWRGDTVNQVWIKRTTAAGDTTTAEPDFFGGRAATKNLHPLAGHDPVNCTRQMGVPGPWHERLPHFRMEFTPSSGEELQAEYFVAREDGPAAVKALQRLGERLAPVLLISEVRTIAADDLWLSPCYRRPSVALHFTFTRDWPAVARVLPDIEAALSPFEPRPHWGKVFAMPPETVRSRYEKLPAFRALLDAHDPGGKFRNGFVDRYVFGHG